jgi:SAM-dependent methyltransferase
MSDLQSQYENYPYPPCDPENEMPGATRTVANDLDLINHHLFDGKRDNFDGFRALVAGGGTGYATVHLAQQLSERAPSAEVTHIDLSEASIAIAKRRIEKLGLSNVHFVQGSFLDPESLGSEKFDYINCSGVLHHLESPAAGARALAALLKEDGGMSIMLYGALGRMGIYPAQEMLRMIENDPPNLAAMVDVCKSLFAEMPRSNWLWGRPEANINQHDAVMVDTFLHVRDRAYRVPEIYELAREANLRVVSFLPPEKYDPMLVVKDKGLRERLEKLSVPERQAFAELMHGASMMMHIFYVVPAQDQ